MAPNASLKNCFRSQGALNGSFAAGTWLFRLHLRARMGEGADARANFRVWADTDPDGASPRELTSGWQVGSLLSDLTSVGGVSQATVALGEITMANEYLFVEIAAETT